MLVPSKGAPRKKRFPGHHTFTFDDHWYEVDYQTDEERDAPVAFFFFEGTDPTEHGTEFAVSAVTGELDSVWSVGKWHSFQKRSEDGQLSEGERHRLVMHCHHVLNIVLQHLPDEVEE